MNRDDQKLTVSGDWEFLFLAGGRQWARSGILKTGDSYNLVMVQQEHVAAEEILAQDPELKLPEHRPLLAGRDRMLERLQQAASGG